MNIVHVLFFVNKIRGERERDVTNDYKDLWILFMCFIINKMRERERGGGYSLNVLKSILKVSLIC